MVTRNNLNGFLNKIDVLNPNKLLKATHFRFYTIDMRISAIDKKKVFK
jgi:hypothetical protein